MQTAQGNTTLPYFGTTLIPDPEATETVVRAASARVKAAAERLGQLGAASVETHVKVSQFPAQAILDAAHAYSSNVIAMTTTGRGASRLIIGSVTDEVLRGSSLPLLLYRPTAIAAPETSPTPLNRTAALGV